MTSNPNVILYEISDCPFCAKVNRYLDSRNIVIPKKDIEFDSTALEELQAVGGKTQVPCLFVNGKAMYESLDIIDWFKTQWIS